MWRDDDRGRPCAAIDVAVREASAPTSSKCHGDQTGPHRPQSIDTPSAPEDRLGDFADAELLVTDAAPQAAEIPVQGLERRQLNLRGRTAATAVFVFTLASAGAAR